MSTSEWQALVLNEVNELDLYHGRLDGAAGEVIPVKKVDVSTADSSTIAILSRRWDGTNEMIGSRNILCAIHQARKLGIECLFIDVISTDQTLAGDDLTRQVVEFSKFYRTIQVIATYDDLRVTGEINGFLRIIHRPWILSEAKMLQYNPARIAHVSHIPGGPWELQGTGRGHHMFGLMIYSLRRMRYTGTILAVLNGSIPLVSISDLKYIMADISNLLQVSYSKMCRSDYLLTAAISCELGIEDKSVMFPGIWSGRLNLLDTSFDRYKLHSEELNAEDRIGECTRAKVFLDGTHIANWLEYHMDIYRDFSLSTLDDAESSIIKALQIGSFYDEGYSNNVRFADRDESSDVATSLKTEVYQLDLPSLGICDEYISCNHTSRLD